MKPPQLQPARRGPLRAGIKKGDGIENWSSLTVLRHLNEENKVVCEYKWLFSLQRVNDCFAKAHIRLRALRGGGRVLAKSKPAAAANYATAKLLLALCLGRLTWHLTAHVLQVCEYISLA